MPKVSLIPHELPYDVNEQLKYLRTNIQFCGPDIQVIAVTSCEENEGKTTISLHIAQSFVLLPVRVRAQRLFALLSL